MKSSTKVCQIPKSPPGRGYKWPTLGEAYAHYSGKDLTGAHDAMADAEACLRVFKGLVDDEAVQLNPPRATPSKQNTEVGTPLNASDNIAARASGTRCLEIIPIGKTGEFLVKGSTYQHKTKLKDLGGQWDSIRKGW
eukprot:CAMPEP_0183321430 /NCGR_PEP_ID=MMETSP0160_2-20130417/68866_1 /TAXON_ID=2839 ORGANISM="Odontella Sinensis, Strain Grunow 1884" /NCGR_SAMPLE_ID=MMETSP0160_2 /ASSEMBLY_ACC=CAM_ASM_000250 /LENGTH=136 /DNA_ID=CAMNT_0025488373 /DNA_START=74 /DNA_END=481 /DNA_ORIENTATION=+